VHFESPKPAPQEQLPEFMSQLMPKVPGPQLQDAEHEGPKSPLVHWLHIGPVKLGLQAHMPAELQPGPVDPGREHEQSATKKSKGSAFRSENEKR